MGILSFLKKKDGKAAFVIIGGSDAASLSENGEMDVLNAAFEKINDEIRFAAKYGLRHAALERWKVFEPMVQTIVSELRKSGYEVELTNEFIRFSWDGLDPEKPVQVNG